MKRAIVIGLGLSGSAAARFLQQRGFEVMGVDRMVRELEGVPCFLESAPPSFKGVDLAVVSPGIPDDHFLVQEMRRAGIELVGEVELALRDLPQRIVGVTGSNGKTTTVLLLEHLFRSVGLSAVALGNVGRPLTGYALQGDPKEIVLLELSSFQLERLQAQRLELALVLNVTPNHLDRHGSMENYARAKLSIQHLLSPQGQLFVTESVAKQFAHLLQHSFSILPKSRLLWPGLAEETLQAVCHIAVHFGLSWEEVERALATFQKPPHRIEFVVERSGILFYNDSKATNIDAVMHAVHQLKGPLLLLAGGVDKGASYLPWVKAFHGKVKALFLLGRAAPLMEAELSPYLACTRVETLEQAVGAACRVAARGDTILLSPGCASYDQFRSFEHRGEEFRNIVRRI